MLIYHRWLFSDAIITHGDWTYFFNETLYSLRINYFSLWLSDQNFGRHLSDVGQAPTYALSGVLALNNFLRWEIIERIQYFFPIVIFTPLSAYFLNRYIFKNVLAACIGAGVYSFNSYILTLQTGHITLATAFALAPFAILFFIKALNEKKILFCIVSALTLFGLSSYEPRVALIVSVVLAIYTIFKLFENFDFSIIIYSIVSFSVFLFLSIYWILGMIMSGGGQENAILSRELWGSSFYNLTRSIALFHPWWTGGKIAVFETQHIPIYFFLVPVISFCGLILGKKNRLVLFFSIISIFGILLSKQAVSPFPELYKWLFTHIPGFQVFREASKFYFLIAIGYSVLISSFVYYVTLNKNKVIKNVGIILTIIVVFIFLGNTRSFFSGGVETLFVPRQIPDDYKIYNEFINSQSYFFRTYWVPHTSKWATYTDKHPRLVGVNIADKMWKNFVDGDIHPRDRFLKIIDPFNKYFSDHLLDAGSIKYIVVPLSDYSNDDNFFIDYGGRENPNIRQWYIDNLDKLSYLKRIDIGTTELVVYENSNYKNYFRSFLDLTQYDSYLNINKKFEFVLDTISDKEDFIVSEKKFEFPTQKITRLFEFLTPEEIQNKEIVLRDIPTNGKTYLYSNNITAEIEILQSQIKILEKDDDIIRDYYSAIDVLSGSSLGITYKHDNFSYKNDILNFSFEDGMWQKAVSDCNAYDDNPLISMKLSSDRTDGLNSLELSSIRHNACTSTGKIYLKSNASYLLSFDYKSDDGKIAAFYLGFGKNNYISKRLPITNNEWHHFSKIISIPNGVEEASLAVYSFSQDEKTNIRTLYDNFHLIELPDIQNHYYLVSDPQTNFVDPKEVTFDLLNPTKKLVHIKGATTPFYLAMSESFHPQWQAQLTNNKIGIVDSNAFNFRLSTLYSRFIASWIPWVKPDRISDDKHFELNGFLNGWFVEPEQLCESKVKSQKSESDELNSACKLNADGSYDIEMTIEFFPQRWFYLGLLISGTTLAGCLGYLGYDFVKRRKRRAGERERERVGDME
ncbi:MAG: hypothetical protein M0P97_00870 [Candidatus Moranbacteria bacterium]|jgi:hypothetical protein|nr:hypothetical protein [Candidatus Moranbacteria bacterium]